MRNSTAQSGETLFDSLISELIESRDDKSIIEICLSGNQKAIKAVPLRYRLIALGFVKKRSLDEVNESLTENGYDKLYARNLTEATLIYAFSNNLEYEEWIEVCREANTYRDMLTSEAALSGGSVSLNDVRNYVLGNSSVENEVALTLHKTKVLTMDLSNDNLDRKILGDYILSNISSFCTYREKSRYYFCKYLMYFLETRKNNYLRAIESGSDLTYPLEGLRVFKKLSQLKRKKPTATEADELLSAAALSFGEIYQDFQDFYFEYTSQDWMDIVLEKYGEIDTLSPKKRKSLASYIRTYNKQVSQMSDDEVLQWQSDELKRREAAKDSSDAQPSRVGESFIRKAVRGEVDIDRTTLMAFLVFFDSGSKTPPEHSINAERLNSILTECGFSALKDGNYCDEFFIDYMDASDPIEFLIEEAEIMAMSEENFYLYKTYLNSDSSDTEWKRIIFKP